MYWPMTFSGGRYVFGLFNYWLGFSNRRCGAYRIIDLGYFKIMWTRA